MIENDKETAVKQLPDKELALNVRNAIEHLHRVLRTARGEGLIIDLNNINQIGHPAFAYKDCAKISRSL